MITLSPMQKAWLISIVHDGPTACCLDGPSSRLTHQGLTTRTADGKLAATDLGRQTIKCLNGEPSTLRAVK